MLPYYLTSFGNQIHRFVFNLVPIQYGILLVPFLLIKNHVTIYFTLLTNHSVLVKNTKLTSTNCTPDRSYLSELQGCTVQTHKHYVKISGAFYDSSSSAYGLEFGYSKFIPMLITTIIFVVLKKQGRERGRRVNHRTGGNIRDKKEKDMNLNWEGVHVSTDGDKRWPSGADGGSDTGSGQRKPVSDAHFVQFRPNQPTGFEFLESELRVFVDFPP